MDPLTITALAAKESLSTAILKEACLQLSKSEVEKLVPIQIAEGPFLQVNALVENIPLGEQQASFFSASEFREISVFERNDIHGVQIRLGDLELNLSLQEGDVLDILGVGNAISYAMTPAIEQFTLVRLQELSGQDIPVISRLESSKVEIPTRVAVAIKPSQAGDFLRELENVSGSIQELEKPLWFTAKRIDYLVGHQYVAGQICDVPLVGGISNMIFKNNLDLDLKGTDWARLGEDVFMVISIAAIPLAPAAGGLKMAGWIGANAIFGAMSQGTISYLKNQSTDLALKNAGKGALLGAVGGVAGVAAAAKIVPAISNKLLASTASGATVGSLTEGASATIRVVERGDDVAAAAREIAVLALAGGVGGGAIGTASYGVSKIVTKLSPATIPHSEITIAKKAGDFEKWQKQIEPILPTDRNVHMGDVRNYSKQLDTNLDGFAAHLKATNPQFADHVNRMTQEYSDAVAAKDLGAIAKLETQMKRNLAGDLGEALGVAKFRPFFEKFTTQKSVQDGATIIDVVFEGAKQPLAIRGHRLVEKGGNLAVEFKAGTESYFKSEIDSGHLLKQVGGHTDFGKGMVVTTRDVKDALLDTGNAKQILKDAGSTVYRLLPYKAEIDAAVARLVRGDSV